MSKSTRSFKKKPNILILLTDQQRTIQHFPEKWAETYLPNTTHLKKTGVTFKNNMCSSTACSPSRSTIFSGTYPTVNGVLKVNDNLDMSRTLPMGGSLITLGKVMTDAGYKMVYKGKWHLDESFNAFSNLRPSDKDRMMIEDDAMENHYDMPGWTSPDLGGGEASVTNEINPEYILNEIYDDDDNYNPRNTVLNSIGGGNVKNDSRIVNGKNLSNDQKSAVDFLKEYNPNEEDPFCLVVSLANPHDIWVYPYTYKSAGYEEEVWLNDEIYGSFELPNSYHVKLPSKPNAQLAFLNFFQGGPLNPDSDDPINYIKFYAYLQTLIDDLTGDIINALQNNKYVGDQLEQDTLIFRLSDHGEMAMAQGGLRQKENNVYNETIKVPMIVSNPNLPEINVVKDDFVSLIDLIPTLAELVELEISEKYVIQGTSFAKAILGEKSIQKNFNFFATDDGSLSMYSSIRAIVNSDYKYAVYYASNYSDTTGETGILNYNGLLDVSSKKVEFELYDSKNDPDEMVNLLAAPSKLRNDNIKAIWIQLHELLTEQMVKTYTCPDKWELADPEKQND